MFNKKITNLRIFNIYTNYIKFNEKIALKYF